MNEIQAQIYADTLGFYRQGGLMTSKQRFLTEPKNICGKVTEELVAGIIKYTQ
jgi:hypothetical protein